jgi:hypothetical protein
VLRGIGVRIAMPVASASWPGVSRIDVKTAGR